MTQLKLSFSHIPWGSTGFGLELLLISQHHHPVDVHIFFNNKKRFLGWMDSEHTLILSISEESSQNQW